MTSKSINLGPLPKNDRQADLQEMSLTAFRLAFPEDRFRIRDERQIDAGVDASLEILYASSYTNFRSQIQIKATEHPNVNADGSISLPVSVANLNYLLNGTSPLYVLYIVPTGELRYVWARNEKKRIEAENPGWQSQQSVTLRFYDCISEAALEEIITCAIQEGEINRQIQQNLTQYSLLNEAFVSINRDNLEVNSSEELYEQLIAGGEIAIVNGLANEVIHAVSKLGPDRSKDVRIQELLTYAQFSTGDYQLALALASKILANDDQVNNDARIMLNEIRQASQYHLGMISMDEYLACEEELAKEIDGDFALLRKLDAARLNLLRTTDYQQHQQLLSIILECATRIEVSTSIPAPMKLHAKLLQLESEGSASIREFLEFTAEANVAMRIGRSGQVFQGLSRTIIRSRRWEDEMVKAFETAKCLSHPLLLADAYLTYALVNQVRFSTMAICILQNDINKTIPEEALDNIVEMVEGACTIYEGINRVDGALRSKLLKANVLDLLGRDQEVVAIGQDVFKTASLLGLAHLTSGALECISGETVLARTRKAIKEAKARDSDEFWSTMNDEEMKQFATDLLRYMGRPDSHTELLLSDLRVARRLSLERMNWCTHLYITPEETYPVHAGGIIQISPERLCRCDEFNRVSHVPCRNVETVLSAFKRAHCFKCRSRNPKNSDNSTDE